MIFLILKIIATLYIISEIIFHIGLTVMGYRPTKLQTLVMISGSIILLIMIWR